MAGKINFLNQEKIGEVIFSSPKITRKKSGELTGYASIDNPHLQYYKEGADKVKVPEQTIYQALVANNSDYLDGIAFIDAERNDKQITYGEFIRDIDKMASALAALGLKAGDEIVASTKNSYESKVLMFAKSKLGLVEHGIDPTNSPVEKQRMTEETSAKYCFIAEDVLPASQTIINSAQIEKVIILPAMDSETVKTEPTNDKYLDFHEFMSMGKDEVETHEFNQYEVSTVLYTSGSTGKSKGVMLTDYNSVSKYTKQIHSNWKWQREKINLSCLPDMIAFGQSESTISPLLAGETNVIADCYKGLTLFDYYIVKYKPNHVACSPVHMERLLNSEIITDDTDLSHCEMFPCGGDGMKIKSDQLVRTFLKDHGAEDSFGQGCGFSESDGAFCYGQGEANEVGYMGIPLAGNIQGVFDPVTGKELKYGEVGEWAVQTDTCMLGYYGSATDKNKDALKVHADGQIWLHPGDRVHVNEQGKTFMHDRTSRTFNCMGMNVYPSKLEEFLSSHQAIKKCIVSGIKNPFVEAVEITEQKVPVANITIEDEYKGREEEIIDELDQILAQHAESYIDMYAYIFREELPITFRGKINYQQLEAEGFQESEDKKVFVKIPSTQPQN